MLIETEMIDEISNDINVSKIKVHYDGRIICIDVRLKNGVGIYRVISASQRTLKKTVGELKKQIKIIASKQKQKQNKRRRRDVRKEKNSN